jgi:hypothetical protein
MFALAWLFLPDQPAYRTGLITVELARCIAMVIAWNDLACGDREAAAVLVAVNSLFQVVTFGLLHRFYLTVLAGWLGLHGAALEASAWAIARNVLIFLGIPLAAGYLSRRIGRRPAAGAGTSGASCPGSARGRCTGCCSRSSSCSPSRAGPLLVALVYVSLAATAALPPSGTAGHKVSCRRWCSKCCVGKW